MTTPAHGDTIAVVAADATGLSVSLIQSIFSGFGSGVLEPETGILLHNRGACFSSDPASPNALGPGKRPLHTLMPLIGTTDGRPTWVAGTMGGRAQAQIHAQMLLRREAGADVVTAVSAPRMIVGDLPPSGERREEAPHTPSLRAQRSNPDYLRGKILDCFAALAMTWKHLSASHHSALRKTCAAIVLS